MKGWEGVIRAIMPPVWHMNEHKGMGGTEGGIPCCKGSGHCVAKSTNILKRKFNNTYKNLYTNNFNIFHWKCI